MERQTVIMESRKKNKTKKMSLNKYPGILLGSFLEFFCLCHCCSSFSEFLFVNIQNSVVHEVSKWSYNLSTQRFNFKRIFTWCVNGKNTIWEYHILRWYSHFKENIINSKILYLEEYLEDILKHRTFHMSII